jgi:hypothetical protein
MDIHVPTLFSQDTKVRPLQSYRAATGLTTALDASISRWETEGALLDCHGAFHHFVDCCRLSVYSYECGCTMTRNLSIERILKVAKKGELDHLLNSHYTIYTDPNWQEKLQLCRDLKDAGYLQANFKEDFFGTPIFLDGPARITIAGRDYLASLEQKRLWRRVIKWMVALFLRLLHLS